MNSLINFWYPKECRSYQRNKLYIKYVRVLSQVIFPFHFYFLSISLIDYEVQLILVLKFRTQANIYISRTFIRIGRHSYVEYRSTECTVNCMNATLTEWYGTFYVFRRRIKFLKLNIIHQRNLQLSSKIRIKL